MRNRLLIFAWCFLLLALSFHVANAKEKSQKEKSGSPTPAKKAKDGNESKKGQIGAYAGYTCPQFPVGTVGSEYLFYAHQYPTCPGPYTVAYLIGNYANFPIQQCGNGCETDDEAAVQQDDNGTIEYSDELIADPRRKPNEQQIPMHMEANLRAKTEAAPSFHKFKLKDGTEIDVKLFQFSDRDVVQHKRKIFRVALQVISLPEEVELGDAIIEETELGSYGSRKFRRGVLWEDKQEVLLITKD